MHDGLGEEEGKEDADGPREKLEGPRAVVDVSVAGVGAVDDARGGERETAEEEKSAEGDARHRARAEPRGEGSTPTAESQDILWTSGSA